MIKFRREYIAARVVEVLSASPHRTAPPCPYFGPCTGCQWQHVDYQHQLQIKGRILLNALRDVGGFQIATDIAHGAGPPEQYGYRNHARFTVGPQRRSSGLR